MVDHQIVISCFPLSLFQSPDYDTYTPSRKYYAPALTHHSSDDGTGGGGCLAPPKTEHRRHSLTDRIANVLHL